MNTLRELFSRVNKVTRNEFLGECWEINGTSVGRGYPLVWFRGKKTKAHRIVFCLLIGDSGGSCAMHMCDNKKCINPSHITSGTAGQNIKDYFARNHIYAANSGSDEMRNMALDMLKNGCRAKLVAEHCGIAFWAVQNMRAALLKSGDPGVSRRWRHSTPKDLARVVELQDGGASIEDIATALGVHKTTVDRMLKRGRKAAAQFSQQD